MLECQPKNWKKQMSDIYEPNELKCLGSYGVNVQIDRSVRFIHPENIHIGSNVRIDAWCFLSAGSGIFIGNNVHLALSVYLSGNGAPITLENFCGVASRCSIFTATDDYKEGWLTGPTVPEHYKNVRVGPVTLEKHVIVGCNSIILPNCTLKIGSSVGALSLISKDVPEYEIVVGCPLRVLGKRDKNRLEQLETDYLANNIVGGETWLTHSED
jgi:acetyltransferase-like isoleucine patch superfamily enzyme